MTKFNPKRDLPYIAAAAQSILYTWAGITLLGTWGWIPGLVTGVLVSFVIAYASSQYTETAKERKPFAKWLMVGIAIFSPAIIGTAMFFDIRPDTNPIWRGIIGAMLGFLPDFSVFLTGFIAGKGLVKQDTQPPAQTTQPAPQRRKKPAKVVRQPISNDELIAEIIRNPRATNVQLGRHFGVTPQAISKRRAKLTPIDMGLAK